MGCGASSPSESQEPEKEASTTRLAAARKEVSISRPLNTTNHRITTPTNGTAERDGGEGTQPNPLVASSTAAKEHHPPPAGTAGKSLVLAPTPREAGGGALPTATVVPPSQPAVVAAPPPASSSNPSASAAAALAATSAAASAAAAPAFPSYTISDSRGCRVVTMIQNRVKVETMCKWLDNVLRSREEAGGVFRSIDAHREHPLTRDDVGRETSSVSSRAGQSRVSEQSMTVFLNVSTTHDMQSRTMVGTTAAQGGSQVDEQLASRAGPVEDE